MGMQLIEKIIDDLNTYLSANMTAKLAVVQADYSPVITLPAIANYFIAEQEAIAKYPAVILLGDNTQPADQGGNWIHAQHNITVICLVTDQNTTTLRRKLYRYVRALTELIKATQDAWGLLVLIQSINYSPIYAGDGQFLSDCSITITVQKMEDIV